MNCEQASEQILDLVDGELGEAEAAHLREHLEMCGACREETAAARETWSMMGRMEEGRPSDAMRARFSEMLAGHRSGPGAAGRATSLAGWLRILRPARPALQAAVALGMLLLGVWLGPRLGSGPGASREIRQLRAEMESMNQAIVFSLLENRSASERLRAVSLTGETLPDDRLIDALLQVVTTDPSVNVRLAALEVLSQMAKRPDVHQRLLEAFPTQSSPTMTVALADVLMAVDGPRSRTVIENTMNGKELPDDVRAYLRNALVEER